MRVELSSGNYNIIASGTVFLFGDAEDLTIRVDNVNGCPLCITLKFYKDDSGEPTVKRDIVENNLVLSCFNFGGEGIGLARPTHIGDADGKGVFLTFWVYEEGKKHVKSVKYTIFCE